MSQSPPDSVFRLLNEVGIVAQLSATLFERVMPEGMTLAQFTVLNHFVRLGGTRRPSDLASAFQVSRGTMTSTLSRLEAKGLVALSPDESDGRGRIVAITEAGRAMREDCIAALRPIMADIEARLGAQTIEAAIAPLVALRQDLDRRR